MKSRNFFQKVFLGVQGQSPAQKGKIMKKTFSLEELDCANCAAKMETAINKIDGVTSATVSFMTQKLTIEADEKDFPKILKEAQKVIKKVEPDCRIILG